MKDSTRLIVIGVLIVVIIIASVFAVIQDNQRMETASGATVPSESGIPVSEGAVPEESSISVSEDASPAEENPPVPAEAADPEEDGSGQESAEPSDSVTGVPAAS